MIFKLILSIVLFLFCFQTTAYGDHIAGLDMHYQCLGEGATSDTRIFKLTQIQYFECGVEIVYGAIIAYQQHNEISSPLTLDLDTFFIVENPEYLCVEIPPNICIEKRIYSVDLELTISDSSYFFYFNDCCRTENLTNIEDPIISGLSIFVELTPEAQSICNSSPAFQSLPPTIICSSTPFEFSQHAIDLDGDQLIYELCTPLDFDLSLFGQPPPYDPVSFILPNYSSAHPLGFNILNIDSNTGLLSGLPVTIGLFAFGLCVKEYRNGQLLTTTIRDYQLNVAACSSLVNAKIELESPLNNNDYSLTSCNETIQFINNSTQQSNISNLLWTFTKDNYTDTSTVWSPTIFFPEGGTYNGTLVLNPDGECTDTAYLTVNVVADIAADFDFTYDTCVGGPVQFINHSYTDGSTITNWQWDFGDGSFSNEKTPLQHFENPGSFEVQLNIADEFNCRDSVIKSIEWLPAPEVIIISPDFSEGCAPLEVAFNNLSWPIDSAYNIYWNFGDNTEESNLISPAHLYENEGVYSISVSVVSPIGCMVDTTFTNLIAISGAPLAAFDFAPEELSMLDNEFTINNHSQNAAFWNWQFDEDAASLDWEPNHFFEEVGTHSIRLVVSDSYGCVDTLIRNIIVHPESTFFLPSAFTPNGDGLNDYFSGTGIVDYISDFQLFVWDRWGQQVFATEDPTAEWNGQFQNTGRALTAGVYTCKVSFFKARGERQEIKSFVTLIR